MVGHVVIGYNVFIIHRKKQLLMDPFGVNQGDLNRRGCTAEYHTSPLSAAKPHWVLKDACMENRPSFFFLAGLTAEMAASTEEWE